MMIPITITKENNKDTFDNIKAKYISKGNSGNSDNNKDNKVIKIRQ